MNHNASSYRNYRCRCEVCSASHAALTAKYRKRRAAGRVLIDGRLTAVDAARHGSASTYCNWQCRCRPCTDAANVAQR